MNSHWSVCTFRSDFFRYSSIISSSSSTAMSFSTLIAETNFIKISNLSSSLLSSDLSDFEKQFDNDLDLDKADKKTLNKYVLYRLTQYTLLDSVDYGLWIFIQADFANFIEKHLNQLNESIWKSLLDYCYSHDYWIDHDNFRKCFANFLKILNVNSEYNNNNWTADQIKWMKYNYKKLSSSTRQRKQKIIEIINSINQSKIAENTETIIKFKSTITAYFHSQATQFQDARFRSLQSSQNQQNLHNVQNDQISLRQSSSREFHYSQILKDQTSTQISQYLVDQSSVNYEHSSKQSSSSSSSSSLSSSSSHSISRLYQTNQSENDFFRQLALLNKIYKKKDKFSDTDSNFDYKVMIFYDKCKRASLSSHAYIQDVSIMFSNQTLIHYYSNQLQLNHDFFDFCINIKNAFEESEWERRNLIRRQIISISDVVAVNHDVFLSECLQKMCLEMNIIQRELDSAFYDSTHLRENIIRVCRDHFALTNDLNNVSINVSDLINSLHISITNYEVVQKSASFETYLQSNSNSFNQNQDDQYFTDRQYRREEYSNRRDEFRDEDRSNDKFRTSRFSKICFVCKKFDCWSSNHSQKERDDSKKRFSNRHSQYKIRSEYDRRLKQYIADFEDIIISDSDDEDATQYFDDLSSISDDLSSISSVIDDTKLIEFESNELFLTSLADLQNVEFINSSLVTSSLAIFLTNSLANKTFEHRLISKNITNVLINESFDFTFIRSLIRHMMTVNSKTS